MRLLRLLQFLRHLCNRSRTVGRNILAHLCKTEVYRLLAHTNTFLGISPR